MKRILCILILITLILSVTLVGYMTEEKLEWNEDWPTKIRIGTSKIGGNAYMWGSTLANVLKEEFPQLDVVIEQSSSSVGNVKLTKIGDIEFGTSTTDTAYDAWNGVEGKSFKGEKYQSFRILMTMTPSPTMWVSLKKNDITNVKQFTGKFGGNIKGSATHVMVQTVFKTLGVKAEIISLAITDSVQALRAGVINGYAIGSPNPATEELALQEDIRILGISGKDADTFLKSNPKYVYPLMIPGGRYKGLDENIEAVGMYTIFIARADLPEDMVYTVLKAWYKHPEILKATWPVLVEGTNPVNVKSISSFAPLHKGSIKYYKEIGAEIGEKAILLDE